MTVNQIDGRDILLHQIHILQFFVEKEIKKMQVEVFGMQMKVEHIQHALGLYAIAKDVQPLLAVIEIVRPIHFYN